MNKTKKTFTLFTQRFILVLAIYQIVRIGFYFYNQSFFPEINAEIFIGGLWFDLSVLGYINILFAILHLIPTRLQQNKVYQNILFYGFLDRKSTRLNSSHVRISYAVFCLKKKKIKYIS